MKTVILTEQPINNINGMKYFRDKLAGEDKAEVTCLQYSPKERRDIIGEIRALRPDVLVTVDLPGFEQRTLTDNISYNLLDCKQLHLLLHENPGNESCLAGQLSIAMFFYCEGDALYNRLAQRYPHLPYLKKLPGKPENSGQLYADDRTESRSGACYYEALQEMLQEWRPGL